MIGQKYPTVSVEKYVIMPDHIHMILLLDRRVAGTGNPSPTAGTVIGWFKYQTTKCCNLITNEQGKRFWQRSYFDHVIRNGEDFDDVWEYIDTNPLRWVLRHQENRM